MSQHEFDLAVTGDIVFHNTIVNNGTIYIEGERIAAFSDTPGDFRFGRHIDARNKLVFPGAIDSHVHSLSYPGEGFGNSTKAACAGGVTTIIDMPVDAPAGIATPEALKKKIAEVEKESHVDVALLGSVKNDTLEHITGLSEAGACGFKLSLFDTDPDRFPRVSDGRLLEAFARIAETGLTAGVHAENDEIIKDLISQYQKEGKTYPLAHCQTRPEVSETESVLKGLEIARAAGVRFHLYHISCSRAIDLAQYYRKDGNPVTIETCPHYLIFSEKDMESLKGKLRINPPVRKKGESERLWQKLQSGQIDCVSSDHAPWPVEKKNKSSIFDNASGAPGVETLLPLLFSEGVSKSRISVFKLAEAVMENPAKIFGLFPQKGTLSIGSDADITVFDPRQKWTVRAEELHSIAGWTPYEGMEVTGKVDTTIVRGKIVYHKGEITDGQGHGRFIHPLNNYQHLNKSKG